MAIKTTDNRKTPSRVKGFFRAHEQLISGWALDTGDLEKKLDVEIFIDGQSVGFARADRYDAVVQAQYGGDGKHSFDFYFADPPKGWTEGEVLAKEKREGVELRTKSSRASRSQGDALAFSLDEVSLTRITGQASGYPSLGQATLEFWQDDRRVVSGIPIQWESKAERTFSAQLSPEAMQLLLGGPVTVAIAGLKEAGKGIPLALRPTALVTRVDDELLVELKTDFDCESLDISIEFAHEGWAPKQVSTIVSNGRASCTWPDDMPADGTTVRISICGTAIPTRQELDLRDPAFATLGDDRHDVWQVSEGCSGEHGMYAFPPELASELGLSGDIAYFWRSSEGDGIKVFQEVGSHFAIHDRLTRNLVVRARKGAILTFRLVDEQGILGEVTSVARGQHRWLPLNLELELSRGINGRVRLEIEATGTGVDELELALGNSLQAVDAVNDAETSPLLVNEGITEWPFGAGVRRHTMRGEICTGWRLFNQKCGTPMLSRAIMDPTDSSIGLAIAAPEVTSLLRLEADLSGPEVTLQSTVLKFRAGMPQAARQLMAQSAEATPEFALIDRVFVIRRTRYATADGFDEIDQRSADVARKVPIAWEMERHSYAIPRCEFPDIEDDESSPLDSARTQRTYHLVFEFRRSMVFAIDNVEILGINDASNDAEEAQLRLEDRNIELQVPRTKGTEHWIAPTAVLLLTRSTNARTPLKWSTETSRELVEIVIPVHNALKETLECLDSLGRCTTVPIMVHLIDDGSDAPVAAALEAYASERPWIRVHSLGQNRGYTFAADFGIRKAQSNWVVLLNSDTVVTRGWLEGMIRCARSDPKIAFVGPLSNAASYQSIPHLYDAAGKFKVNSLPPGLTPDDVANVVRRVSTRDYPDAPLLNGFCTLMNRSTFLAVGGLNHGAFPAGYGEENDICIRVRKAGGRLAIADDVYVFHHKSASFGNARRAQLSKQGGVALRKLHPDVAINGLSAEFREIPSLVAARAAVARELGRILGSPTSDQSTAEPPQQTSETSHDIVA